MLQQCQTHNDHRAACEDLDVLAAAQLLVALRSNYILAIAVSQTIVPAWPPLKLEAGLKSILNRLKIDEEDEKAAMARQLLDCCFRIATNEVAPPGVGGYWPSRRRGALLEALVAGLLERRGLTTRREARFSARRYESPCLDVLGINDEPDRIYDFEAYECKRDPLDLTDEILEGLASATSEMRGEAAILNAVATLRDARYLDDMLEDLTVPASTRRVTLESILDLATEPPSLPLAV